MEPQAVLPPLLVFPVTERPVEPPAESPLLLVARARYALDLCRQGRWKMAHELMARVVASLAPELSARWPDPALRV